MNAARAERFFDRMVSIGGWVGLLIWTFNAAQHLLVLEFFEAGASILLVAGCLMIIGRKWLMEASTHVPTR